MTVSDEVKANTVDQVRSLFECMSSARLQRRYKAVVPFVHVPDELLAQWEAEEPHLDVTPWFNEIFSVEQLAAFRVYAGEVRKFHRECGFDIPDVPEALKDAHWRRLMASALTVLETFGPKVS